MALAFRPRLAEFPAISLRQVPLLATMLALVLSQGSPSQIRLVLPGLAYEHMQQREADRYGEHLERHLRRTGLAVLASSEIHQSMGDQRRDQLRGCSEVSGCVEFARALGATVVVSGRLTRLEGGGFSGSLRALSTQDGSTLAAHGFSADGEPALLSQLEGAATAIAAVIRTRLGVDPEGAGVSRPMILVPLGAGSVVTILGGLLLHSANQKAHGLQSAAGASAGPGPADTADAFQTRREAGLQQGVAVTLITLGTSSVLTALFIAGWQELAAPPPAQAPGSRPGVSP